MTSNLVWRILMKVGRVPEIKISAINRKKHTAVDVAFPLQRQSFMTCK
jgi:hypothetical protein